MTSIGTGYDLSASQFSPEGKVFQIEYAYKAVENSGTAIAVKTKDGVVFGVERIVESKLYELGSNKRVFEIDNHIGMCIAGYLPDGRHIVKRALEECAYAREQTGEPMGLEELVLRLSQYVHAYTLYSAVRPFGTSVMLSSMEKSGPRLFMIEPSGLYAEYSVGCAVGKAKQNAKTEIEKLDISKLGCRELVKEVSRIVYVVHDEVKDKNFELDLSVVGDMTEGQHHIFQGQELRDVEDYARKCIEDDDSDDDL